MAVTTVAVQDKGALEKFLRVPYRIYRNDANYVFPMMNELRHFLDKDKNPFFKHAESRLWIALNDKGEVVGRIGAAVDRYNNEHHGEQVGFFGFYETDDDPAVAEKLLATARDWIQSQGMQIMRGPGCFTSNHDWYGLQVSGKFNRPVIGMPYNPRYYEKQFEDFGLTGAKDLYAWHVDTGGQIPPKLTQIIDRILARPDLVIRPFDMKNFMAEASIVRQLYNDCWSRNWGFIPMNDEEFAHSAKDMKSLVNPDFLLIAELAGKPVGFSLTIPDFNQATQPLKGHLLPFGWLKFMLAKRKIDYARTLLMGVLPDYHKLGIDMAMVYRTVQAAFRGGITAGECSWILEDNKPMNRILEGYGGEIYKTYRVYELPLA